MSRRVYVDAASSPSGIKILEPVVKHMNASGKNGVDEAKIVGPRVVRIDTG